MQYFSLFLVLFSVTSPTRGNSEGSSFLYDVLPPSPPQNDSQLQDEKPNSYSYSFRFYPIDVQNYVCDFLNGVWTCDLKAMMKKEISPRIAEQVCKTQMPIFACNFITLVPLV